MSRLEQEHIVDETLFFNGTSNDGYSLCKSWLHLISAEINGEDEPQHIKAFHEKSLQYDEVSDPSGKSLEDPKTEWSTNIEIQFVEEGDGTKIRVTINPNYEREPWHDFSDSRKIWLNLIGGLARHLSIPLTKSELALYYQREYFREKTWYYSIRVIWHLSAILIVYLISRGGSTSFQLNTLSLIFNVIMIYGSLSNGRLLYSLWKERCLVYGS